MERVRQKMLNEKAAMEASERARKQREIKKFGKQVQQDVLAKRQAEKKATLEAVKRRRKGVGWGQAHLIVCRWVDIYVYAGV
jgi:rRNA-processing protein EBP2